MYEKIDSDKSAATSSFALGGKGRYVVMHCNEVIRLGNVIGKMWELSSVVRIFSIKKEN